MPRRSWLPILGSAVIVAALAVGSAARSPAEAGGPPGADVAVVDLVDLPPCPVAPRSDPSGPHPRWSAAAHLDGSGSLIGWTLVGGRTAGRPLHVELPPESSVSEPVDGRAVVTVDDGSRSVVGILAGSDPCLEIVATVADVARSGLVHPADGTVWFHAVDRSTRSDLGVFAARTAGAAPERIIAALGANDPSVRDVGPVYSTRLRFDPSGDRLAVQSCGARSCRTRFFELATGRETRVDGPNQGRLMAFERDHATFEEVCADLPCPVRTIDFDGIDPMHETEPSR